MSIVSISFLILTFGKEYEALKWSVVESFSISTIEIAREIVKISEAKSEEQLDFQNFGFFTIGGIAGINKYKNNIDDIVDNVVLGICRSSFVFTTMDINHFNPNDSYIYYLDFIVIFMTEVI